ncbi:C4-dicarboxylate TRAP transporter substrate-binding protein [Alloalcanivorax mobilis]|uniref:C4-dicarboxylate TRAP transporter substrate-binding protein n=1 Tax=Alloalcanivorax mobilis TaxID=2019569 RepID=UPI000C76C3FA|nr:C4-dicarboxylate TRAP transporter substrate-binding protein [Alloalcanivorax mobilis]
MQLNRTVLGLTLAACTLIVGVAGASTLRFASGYPPNSIPTAALNQFKKNLASYSDGELDAKVYELSLLNLMETSAGVRDGMADLGIVLTPYFPAEYPRTNLVAEISMSLELGDHSPKQAGLIYTGAMSEFILLHCPDCVAEFGRQNQVFLGSAATPPYSLLCRSEVNSLDDLKGKRLRTSGAQWARWAESVGANPITMSVNEIYEGLSQGVVDCSVQSTPELSVFRLFEVISSITLNYPGGVFGGVGASNVNADTWRGLEPQQRQALLHASSDLSAYFSWGYETAGVANEDTARKQGITIIEPDKAMKETNREYIRADLAKIAKSYEKQYGVKDGAAMITTFRGLLDKWQGLINDVQSADQLADIYWKEVFSKVDVNTYAD